MFFPRIGLLECLRGGGLSRTCPSLRRILFPPRLLQSTHRYDCRGVSRSSNPILLRSNLFYSVCCIDAPETSTKISFYTINVRSNRSFQFCSEECRFVFPDVSANFV